MEVEPWTFGVRLRVVDAILLHEPMASHSRLLGAFAPTELLRAAYAHAERAAT